MCLLVRGLRYACSFSVALSIVKPLVVKKTKQVDKFKMALKAVDVTFQNLDSSEISLTDVSHYYDSDPIKVVSSLRDDKVRPSSFVVDTTPAAGAQASNNEHNAPLVVISRLEEQLEATGPHNIIVLVLRFVSWCCSGTMILLSIITCSYSVLIA